jgi:hypothetical protein
MSECFICKDSENPAELFQTGCLCIDLHVHEQCIISYNRSSNRRFIQRYTCTICNRQFSGNLRNKILSAGNNLQSLDNSDSSDSEELDNVNITNNTSQMQLNRIFNVFDTAKPYLIKYAIIIFAYFILSSLIIYVYREQHYEYSSSLKNFEIKNIPTKYGNIYSYYADTECLNNTLKLNTNLYNKSISFLDNYYYNSAIDTYNIKFIICEFELECNNNIKFISKNSIGISQSVYITCFLVNILIICGFIICAKYTLITICNNVLNSQMRH